MIRVFLEWLESKPFERQVLILAVTLDPIGFAAGYLIAPEFGVDPLVGGIYGLVAASLPISLWLMRHTE